MQSECGCEYITYASESKVMTLSVFYFSVRVWGVVMYPPWMVSGLGFTFYLPRALPNPKRQPRVAPDQERVSDETDRRGRDGVGPERIGVGRKRKSRRRRRRRKRRNGVNDVVEAFGVDSVPECDEAPARRLGEISDGQEGQIVQGTPERGANLGKVLLGKSEEGGDGGEKGGLGRTGGRGMASVAREGGRRGPSRGGKITGNPEYEVSRAS